MSEGEWAVCVIRGDDLRLWWRGAVVWRRLQGGLVTGPGTQTAGVAMRLVVRRVE